MAVSRNSEQETIPVDYAARKPAKKTQNIREGTDYADLVIYGIIYIYTEAVKFINELGQ